MDLEDNYTVGECLSMCPDEEIDLRVRESLVHVLERPRNITDNYRSRMVKSFPRSAAGKSMHLSKNLRPPYVLMETVKYIINEIVPRDDVPWIIIFEFVTDRFDAVRQDLVIQNISGISYLKIMQPIVQFHAYAAYNLCENESFETYLNNRHLQDTLEGLLNMYDNLEKSVVSELFIEVQTYFEAMYILLHLGDPMAISRALSRVPKTKPSLLKQALDMSLSYYRHNYVRTLKSISTLPILLGSVAALHIPQIRKDLLETMSVAFSNSVCTFPIEELKELLLYDMVTDLDTDCKYYGLKISFGGIIFLKGTFDNEKQTRPPKRLKFIDDRLDDVYVTDLLLIF